MTKKVTVAVYGEGDDNRISRADAVAVVARLECTPFQECHTWMEIHHRPFKQLVQLNDAVFQVVPCRIHASVYRMASAM